MGASATRRATNAPGYSGRSRMTIQANSGWLRAVSAWIALAITASMIWYGTYWLAWVGQRQVASIQRSSDARSSLLVVGDPLKSPAQFDGSRQLALLLKDSADRSCISFGDNEHGSSMGVGTAMGKQLDADYAAGCGFAHG